jgi:hypothetical protein
VFAAAFLAQPGSLRAEDSPELIQPPICSAETAYQPALAGLCEVTPRDDGYPGNKVKINLTAKTSRIEVGGYSVVTEHYNDTYIPPVVRANAGDIVASHLENLLECGGKHENGGPMDRGTRHNPTAIRKQLSAARNVSTWAP